MAFLGLRSRPLGQVLTARKRPRLSYQAFILMLVLELPSGSHGLFFDIPLMALQLFILIVNNNKYKPPYHCTRKLNGNYDHEI